jgi:regulator of sigma E protease
MFLSYSGDFFMILLRSIGFIAQNFMFILAGIIGIGFCIGFHELGHYLFCKLFDVRTPSFSIGFGPSLWKKKIGETQFSLSAIPLGGYVEIAGAAEVGQGDQKDAHSKDKRSFAVKPYWQKLLVMLGGIIFNLMFAYFALILLHLIGMPKNIPVIKTVADQSIAQKLDLQPQDRITAVNGQEINQDLSKLYTALLSGQETTLTITRNDQIMTIPVAAGTSPDNLGITFVSVKNKGLSLVESVKKGITLTNKYIIGTAMSLKSMFAKRDINGVQGPLGIIQIISNGIRESFSLFLLLLALISVSLAVMNLIPLPILDGGQILFYTIEAIIRRPIPVKIKEYIHMGSWILILGLIVWISIQDVWRMAKPLVTKFTGKI